MTKEFSASLFLLATICGCGNASGTQPAAPTMQSAQRPCEADGDPSGRIMNGVKCWQIPQDRKPCEADGNPSGKPRVTHECFRQWGWRHHDGSP